MNQNLVHELKFKCAQLDKFWKIKIDSDRKSWNCDTFVKYIWQCMMGAMNLIFVIEFQI